MCFAVLKLKMKYLIESLPYGIGAEAKTETDFFEICERENIEVIWTPTKFSFHCSSPLGSFITISLRLTGLKRLFVMYHELGHHFISPGKEYSVSWCNMPNEVDRDEKEADAIAHAAIIPARDLYRLPELTESAGRYGRKFKTERERLNFIYQV